MNRYVDIPGTTDDIPEDMRTAARSRFVDITDTPFAEEVFEAIDTLGVWKNDIKIQMGTRFPVLKQLYPKGDESPDSVLTMPLEYILLTNPEMTMLYVGPEKKILSGITVAMAMGPHAAAAAPAAAAPAPSAPVAAGGAGGGGGAAAFSLEDIKASNLPAGSKEAWVDVTATPLGVKLLEKAKKETLTTIYGKPVKRTDGEGTLYFEPFDKGTRKTFALPEGYILITDGGMKQFLVGPRAKTFTPRVFRKSRRAHRTSSRRRASRRASNRR